MSEDKTNPENSNALENKSSDENGKVVVNVHNDSQNTATAGPGVNSCHPCPASCSATALYQSQITGLQSKITDLDNAIAKERASAAEQARQYDDRCNNYEAAIKKKDEQAGVYRGNIDTLKNSVSEKEAENLELANKYDASQKDVEHKVKEIKARDEEISAKEARNARDIKTGKKIKAMFESAREDVSLKNRVNANLEHRLKDAYESNEAAQAQITTLNSEKTVLTEENKRVYSERDEARQAYAKQTGEYEVTLREKEELARKSASDAAIKLEQSEEIGKYKADIANTKEKLGHEQANVTALSEKLNKAVESLKAQDIQLTGQDEQIKSVQKEKFDLEGKLAESKKVIEDKEAALQLQAEQEKEYKNKINTLEGNNTTLIKDNKDLADRAKNTEDELELAKNAASWEYWAGKGANCALNDDYDGVWANYQQAITHAPDKVKVCLDFANLSLHKFKGIGNQDAIAVLTDALSSHNLSRKDRQKLLDARAELHAVSGRHDDAVLDWKSALGTPVLGWFADKWNGLTAKRYSFKKKIANASPFA